MGRGGGESTPPAADHIAGRLIAKAPSPAALEGASALARTEYVIPAPRWLVGRRSAVLTNRNDGLGWQADPYVR